MKIAMSIQTLNQDLPSIEDPDDEPKAPSQGLLKGILPVYAGFFWKRRLVGYYEGFLPNSMTPGRDVRMVRLPDLKWVYGHLGVMPDGRTVIFVRNFKMLENVEGFVPLI
jgi:hypothetical protein